MPSGLPHTKNFPEYFQDKIDFGVSQLGISQTGVALKLNVNAATSGSMNIVGFPAQFAGFITGISVTMTANKTAGVCSVTPTINTTALTAPSGLVTVTVANATKSRVVNVDYGLPGAAFAQGDLLGVKITTDGSLAPTTNDVVVTLYFVYREVQV